jgi:hypothetical protein
VEEYTPNRHYIYDVPEFDVDSAARTTAQCVAEWATDYECWPVGYPDIARAGPLPADVQGRRALIDALWAWLHAWWTERTEFGGLVIVGLYLDRDGEVLLDQHDGVGDDTRLFLKPEEFARLQQCWTERGLPADLYQQVRRRLEQ